MYNIIFENSQGIERIIGVKNTLKEAHKVIHNFCEERNFKIHYINSWIDNSGRLVQDVGSHTEFFYIGKTNNMPMTAEDLLKEE